VKLRDHAIAVRSLSESMGSVAFTIALRRLMSATQQLPSWFTTLGLAVGSGGLGAALLALIQKPWTKAERDLADATADKDKSAGRAEILQAMASTFTDVTGSLREEIERLQGDAGKMRLQAVQFEVELKAALQQVADLEKLLTLKDQKNETLVSEILRVKEERDLARERIVQQEGEIRQLNNLIDSLKRLSK